MGNALEAAKFSVLQGNTGVANKKTTLAAIDTGMADVKAWKDSIDAERLKLKTDTTAKSLSVHNLIHCLFSLLSPPCHQRTTGRDRPGSGSEADPSCRWL